MSMDTTSRTRDVSVLVGTRDSYYVHIGPGVLLKSRSLLPSGFTFRRGLVVTNEKVQRLQLDRFLQGLYGAGVDQASLRLCILGDGECHKTLQSASLLYDELVRAECNRDDVVFAVGGGVVGDIAGFAAATYMRGMRYVQVPTTLLAQVDSSVGGKVAVNHPGGKNLIGAFHQPSAVLCDPTTLSTLPPEIFADGLAEVVKTAVIAGEALFSYLERHVEQILNKDAQVLTHVITECVRTKAAIVEKDETDTGLRMLLNLGHTFGHALESASGYGALSHGRAVSVGLVMACQLAVVAGVGTTDTAQRVSLLLKKFALPVALTDIDLKVSIPNLLERLSLDKKRKGGAVRFVLPRAIGDVQIVDGIPEHLVRSVMEQSKVALD